MPSKETSLATKKPTGAKGAKSRPNASPEPHDSVLDEDLPEDLELADSDLEEVLDEDLHVSLDDDLDEVAIDSDDLEVEDFGAEELHDELEDHVLVDPALLESQTKVAGKSERSDEPEEDDDDVVEDEDVEASLDVILKERLVVEDEPEDDEAPDVDDKSENVERVLPKQPDEFVCRSCFLVKHPNQLANKKQMLCLDCV